MGIPKILKKGQLIVTSGLEVIFFFMLTSSEQEILNARKYKNLKKFSTFQA